MSALLPRSLRRHAVIHRCLLDASAASFAEHGDRNCDIPPAVLEMHDGTYEAIPRWLRWLAVPVELRVARQAGYRQRTEAGDA